MRYPSFQLCGLAAATLLVLATPAAAQDPFVGPRQLDSLITLVPVRGRATLDLALRQAQAAEGSAEERILEARGLRDRAEALRKIIESEINVLKQRIDLAKKEKRDADRQGLEIERDAAEAGKKLLEGREDLRKAEEDVAQAERDRARAAQEAVRLELQLLERREARDRTAGTLDVVSAGRQDRVVRDLEGQVLQKLRDLARRERDLANRTLSLVERQLKLHEAQSRLLNPGE